MSVSSVSPQKQYPPTLDGLAEYLRNCPSVGMALAIGSEVGKVSEGVGFEGDTPLSSEVLGRIQAGLYSRPSDPGNRGDDAFGLLVGALTGTGSPSNPMEANIRFIEELLRQLAAGENYNFQRAYTTATRW